MVAFGLVRTIFFLLIPLGALALLVLLIRILIKTASKRRNILSRERMAALERGMPLPPEAFLDVGRPHPSNSLKSGILEVGLGAGLIVAILICCPESRFWAWGLAVILVGLAQLVYWHFHGRREWEEAREREVELAKRWVGATEVSQNEELGKS